MFQNNLSFRTTYNIPETKIWFLFNAIFRFFCKIGDDLFKLTIMQLNSFIMRGINFPFKAKGHL